MWAFTSFFLLNIFFVFCCLLIYIFIILKKKQKNEIFIFLFICFFMWNLTIVLLFFKYYNYFFYHYKYNIFFLSTFKFDLMGCTLLILSFLTCLFCLYFLDLKIIKHSFIIIYLLIFIVLVLSLFFTTQNYVLFFLLYEFLLFPSVFLTYIASPNLRSKNVSFYFLLWTQLGSFLVFLVIIFLTSKMSKYSFKNLFVNKFTSSDLIFMQILLFIGFGIKIPIWPFHFWLTKTHVEVNTSFSIFLSGILVKTALYGLYKFNIIFANTNYLYFLIVFIGILDSSIKLFAQIDIKKIVAYCTIFEMNLILTNFFFLSYYSYMFLIYFCILHTLLSFYFFFIVDCLYRRFNSRSLVGINNLLNFYPNLAIFLIFGVLLFNGIPISLKFNLELIFFEKIFNFNFLYFFFFFLIQIFCIIFFTKNFFSLLFFTTISKNTIDLTLKELSIFITLSFFFIFISFF